MTIQCVSLENNHLFAGNLIYGQHKLRYDAIINRQNWEVPVIRTMEYDQYDNPASTYLTWRDAQGIVRGVSRLYPTDRPFMLEEYFSHMADGQEIPKGADIIEGSRFCIDKNLPLELRQTIAKELVAGYFEYGLAHGITKIVGIMYPIYWQNLFIQNDIDVTWLGSSVRTPDGKKSRAGYIEISEANYQRFLAKTGLSKNLVIYSDDQRVYEKFVA